MIALLLAVQAATSTGRVKPHFFEERCMELEDKADELSHLCDLALLTVRETRGNLRCPETRAALVAAVERIKSARDEMLETIT